MQIYELISSLEKLTATREKIKSYVNEYKKYQNYLERVVRETNEFEAIPEIFNRYETLVEAKEVLSESQDQSLAVLEEASTNMVSLILFFILFICIKTILPILFERPPYNKQCNFLMD